MEQQTFDAFVEQLKVIARTRYEFTDKGIQQTDWNAYKDYYEGGYSAEDAMAEDMSNG